MIPTWRGAFVLLLAAPLLVLGTWLPAVEWAGWGFVLLAAGLLAFDWRMAGGIERFEVVRQHDARLSLGADNPVHLSVRNRSSRSTQLWVRDEPPEAIPVDRQVLAGSLAGRALWQEMYHLRPLRRGDFRFNHINLRWLGPLGLVMRQGQVQAAAPVKVYPNLLEVRRYDLLLHRNRLQEMGLRHTRMFGEGTEFERLREYMPDDEYRRIDWNATARRNRPVTIEYQTERSQSVMAVIDTGRMMLSPVAQIAKLDYVINTVLLLAYVATGRGDQMGMMTFADDVTRYLSPRQGRGQFYRMLELLYAVEAQPVEPDYQRALSYLALKQRKRALVVIFTDLTSGMSMQSLVRQVSLLRRSSLPLVVTISDPDIHAAAQQRPQDSLSVYQRAIASQLLDDRRVILDSLRQRGVLTLDVPADQLSITVINRYLELKGKIRL
jgi:uncharacterized protein (DUF58 family)